MDQQSGQKTKKRKRRASRKRWTVALLVMILAAGLLTAALLLREPRGGLAEGIVRIQNFLAFAVLGEKPRFYELFLEKNGVDYRLTARDVFDEIGRAHV